MQVKQLSNGATVAGIVLIVLGLVFFVATQGVFDLNWSSIWPIFPMLVGGGILSMALTAENSAARAGVVIGGTIPLLVGAFFFAITLGIFGWGDMGTLWPVFPIIVGLAFVAGYFAGNREQPGLLWPAAIIGGTGLIFLIITGTSIGYGVLAQLWPLALIAVGALMLIPRIWRTARD
jgi:hypothetical protein